MLFLVDGTVPGERGPGGMAWGGCGGRRRHSGSQDSSCMHPTKTMSVFNQLHGPNGTY